MTVSILITRPLPAAEDFALKVRERCGAETNIIVSPLMQIELLADAIPDLKSYKTFVITSVHALATLASSPQATGMKCYCVGTTTTAAAHAAGLDAIDGGGTAEKLAERILQDSPSQPALYLRGEHVATDLSKRLSSAGIETHERVVYRQKPLPLSPKAKTALKGENPIVLSFFSARSAKLFFDAFTSKAPLYIAAISPAVASEIATGIAQELRISDNPEVSAMLDVVQDLATSAKQVESDGKAK